MVSYVTAEGMRKMQQELEQLTTVERPKISQQIEEARDKGDLSENAEYNSVVQILSKVTIRNTKNNAKMQYTLVAEQEANLKQGKIAVNTPIAKGLLGKKVGDIVEVQVPAGVIPFEIIEISR